jgi:prepilin-type N-terminal cleavage/methylation domain-containing protein
MTAAVAQRLGALTRDERGFGLIELLAVLTILATVVGMSVTLFVSAMRSEVDLTERVRAQEEARLALERLRAEVHQACGITPTGVTSSVTLTMPASTATGTPPNFCTGSTVQVTWCTRGTGSRRTLHRVEAATCGTTGGVRWADFLTTGDAFEYVPENASSLAVLRVTFLVDVNPNDSLRAYRLRDALALRNSLRQ